MKQRDWRLVREEKLMGSEVIRFEPSWKKREIKGMQTKRKKKERYNSLVREAKEYGERSSREFKDISRKCEEN